MKKILLMALFFISVPIVLMGCQTNDSDADDIVKVSVSESREFGKINTDFFGVYEDEETVDMFEELFEDAVKQDGIVDIVDPEYDIEAELANGSKKQLHLWVGEADQRSTLMYVEDTNTIYLTPAEDTNWLIGLLK